jgi:hypothetical protein
LENKFNQIIQTCYLRVEIKHTCKMYNHKQ